MNGIVRGSSYPFSPKAGSLLPSAAKRTQHYWIVRIVFNCLKTSCAPGSYVMGVTTEKHEQDDFRKNAVFKQ